MFKSPAWCVFLILTSFMVASGSGASVGNARLCKNTFAFSQKEQRTSERVVNTTSKEEVKWMKSSPKWWLGKVKVSPAVETEASLKLKGFSDHYTAGMDEVHRMEALAEAFRREKVDPDTSHIADFSNQVEKHIAFFQKTPFWEKNKEALKILFHEARLKVKEGKVTYNWWLQWNLKMVSAVDTVSDVYNLQHGHNPTAERIFLGEAITACKSDWDCMIFFPTTKKLNLMAFNQVFLKKVAPLGLVNRPTLLDHTHYHPLDFFVHDIAHATDRNVEQIVNSKKYKNFYNQFMQKTKKLPTDKRKRLELMLFFLTHEFAQRGKLLIQVTDWSNTDFFDHMFHIIRGLILPLLEEESPLTSEYHYYESAVKEFIKVAGEIQVKKSHS